MGSLAAFDYHNHSESFLCDKQSARLDPSLPLELVDPVECAIQTAWSVLHSVPDFSHIPLSEFYEEINSLGQSLFIHVFADG
jgi:hypothetical protein